MIKRLRIKFICTIMALFTVILLVVCCSVLYFTQAQLEEKAYNTLHAVNFSPQPPVGGASNPKPCFVLVMTQEGQIMAFGSPHYDLSDARLTEEIFCAARDTGLQKGILKDYSLRFIRANTYAERYVFMDISAELETMHRVGWICTVALILGIAAFLMISIWLSHLVTRPVEESWKRQRQFLADASHELKTPLTVIMTNAELLQDPAVDPDAKPRFAGNIHRMSGQMRDLVENMLELARVDQGGVYRTMGTVDLSALAEEAALSFEAVYFEAGRSLESRIEPGILLQGSQGHLRQILEILLDNGCKYGELGKPVQLQLQRQGHGSCLLSVASCGPQLTGRECKDIFKRFYRGDQVRPMSGSYGLGLAIAQAVVEDHKGRIWCQSKEGINTFFVSLPAAK